MKKLISIILSLILCCTTVYAEGKDFQVGASGAILMDLDSGRVLWEKNSSAPLAPASTTKIMTAILALEMGKPDDKVEVSQRAARAPEVNMDLRKGEVHELQNLLYALMLQSYNDSAIAIAEHIGGSVEGFAELMNEKAAELGAKDTEFVTPNGLDEGNHHTTAYDMALIARYALQNEEFVKLINTKNAEFTSLDDSHKHYSIVNKNRLLNEYEGALGVKTGFTGKAGHCFVGAAKRNDMTLISVVFASGWGNVGKEQKWRDTKKILNYGFENFNVHKVLDEKKEVSPINVLFSKEKQVGLEISEGYSGMFSQEELGNIKIRLNVKNEVEAPVKKGDVMGKATIELNGETLKTIDIVATEDVLRHDFRTSLFKIINNWLNPKIDCII